MSCRHLSIGRCKATAKVSRGHFEERSRREREWLSYVGRTRRMRSRRRIVTGWLMWSEDPGVVVVGR